VNEYELRTVMAIESVSYIGIITLLPCCNF